MQSLTVCITAQATTRHSAEKNGEFRQVLGLVSLGSWLEFEQTPQQGDSFRARQKCQMLPQSISPDGYDTTVAHAYDNTETITIATSLVSPVDVLVVNLL